MGERRRALDPTRGHDARDALGLSIEQRATWAVEDAAEGARLSQEVAPTEFYTRWGNPTTRRLEQAVAALEGGEAGLAMGSGMGAISTVLLHYAQGKKHIVAQRSLYTATTEILRRLLPAFGVDTTFVEGPDTAGFEEAITADTALVYLETPSNPLLEISDIAAIATRASELGVPVAVDNTFASPVHQRPLELGATVSVHSATKYLSGHSDVTGGVLAADRDTVAALWHTYKLLGPTLGPHDAFLVHRGLKTLELRVQRQTTNAATLAEMLQAHPAVERVHYPGLKDHPGHDVAARQMSGFGAMLSFEVAGGYQAAKRVMEATQVAILGVSLGGVETLIQHPASMTHAPLTPDERAAAGIPEGLVRLSVGIEDIQLLRTDLEQALDQAA